MKGQEDGDMTDWDGQGLPPAARARVARAEGGAPGASLLNVSGQAALEGCGFSVVGEAMGCTVQHLGWRGFGGCGFYGYGGLAGGRGGLGSLLGPQGVIGGPMGTGATVTSGGAGGFVGYAPYVDALYEGYDTAMLRMLFECRDIGADGVVGVRLDVTRLGNDNSEFLAYGTAVRAHSSSRPSSLFSTTLEGNDVAKLLHGGWVPASIIVGLSVAVRHDDWATLRQASTWAGNSEVSGYSELVHHVRSDARGQFHRRSSAYGADGAILSSMNLQIWEQEVAENHRDHVALSSVIGTAIARFHHEEGARTSSLTILPMNDPPDYGRTGPPR